MNWEDIQDAIKAWLAAITGLVVVWENEPRPSILRQAGFCILGTPTGITALGQDFVQEEVTGDDISPVVVGQRVFTVPIRAISRSQSPANTGRTHLEKARLSLKMPSVLEHFQTHSMAIVRADKIVQYDAPFDERVESIASMEVTFAATATMTDPEVLGSIHTISVGSTLKQPNGSTDVPTPPQLDGEIFTLPDV